MYQRIDSFSRETFGANRDFNSQRQEPPLPHLADCVIWRKSMGAVRLPQDGPQRVSRRLGIIGAMDARNSDERLLVPECPSVTVTEGVVRRVYGREILDFPQPFML